MLTVAILLFVPFVAMRFTDEVKWTPLDFTISGVLLLGTGLVCEFVMRKVKKIQYRIAVCAVILATLLVVWAELAVGIIGTRFAGS